MLIKSMSFYTTIKKIKYTNNRNKKIIHVAVLHVLSILDKVILQMKESIFRIACFGFSVLLAKHIKLTCFNQI